METDIQQTIDVLERILEHVPRVLFVTGAVLSADSGRPTYRGNGGLYDIDVT